MSLAHLILFHFSEGATCFASPSLGQQTCCGKELLKECFDETFSSQQCCGHTSQMALEADLQPSGCWYGHFTSDFCCGTPNSPEVRQKSMVYDNIIYPNVSIKLFMRGVLISTYIHSQNPEGWGIPWLLGLSLQLFHLLQHCGYSVY